MSVHLKFLVYHIGLDDLQGTFMETLATVDEVNSPSQRHWVVEYTFYFIRRKIVFFSDVFRNWANKRFTCFS